MWPLTLASGTRESLEGRPRAFAGQDVHSQEQLAHGDDPIGFWRYVVSSHFGNAVMENWQSEYLQFTPFALMTV